MASSSGVIISTLLLLGFVGTGFASVLFSTLEKSLVVDASPKQGQVLKAGEDKIKVTWSLNQTLGSSTQDAYKKVKVKLCYAPKSQKERGWRRTVDELKKDKTCQFTILSTPYDSSMKQQTTEWTVKKNIPTATYFIRAYVFDSNGHEVGFGQTTDAKKNINLFDVQAITGRHVSIDIAAGCFSGFSVLALFFFFYMEKRKAKIAPKN